MQRTLLLDVWVIHNDNSMSPIINSDKIKHYNSIIISDLFNQTAFIRMLEGIVINLFTSDNTIL